MAKVSEYGQMVLKISTALRKSRYSVQGGPRSVKTVKCPKCGKMTIVHGQKTTKKCVFRAWHCANHACDYSVVRRQISK